MKIFHDESVVFIELMEVDVDLVDDVGYENLHETIGESVESVSESLLIMFVVARATKSVMDYEVTTLLVKVNCFISN